MSWPDERFLKWPDVCQRRRAMRRVFKPNVCSKTGSTPSKFCRWLRKTTQTDTTAEYGYPTICVCACVYVCWWRLISGTHNIRSLSYLTAVRAVQLLREQCISHRTSELAHDAKALPIQKF